MFDDNKKALKIWNECNLLREYTAGTGGALPMKLKLSEVKAACEVFNADLDDFESVLEIEKIAYPFIMKKFKNQ